MIDNFTDFILTFLSNLTQTDVFIFAVLALACSAVFVLAAHLIGGQRQ